MNTQLFSSKTQPARPRRRRLSLRWLLIALVLMLVAAPFQDSFSGGEAIEPLSLTLVLVSALVAIGARGRTLAVALLLVVSALTARWLNHFQPGLVPPAVGLVPAILFIAFVIGLLLVFVFHAPRVNADVLCAGIAAYLLLGLLWCLAYSLVAQLIPNAFAFNGNPISKLPLHGFDAAYFSYVTLTTMGYGDITPVANVARMLAAAEALTGTLFVAVLIARLVALYTSQKVESDQTGKGGSGTQND